MSLMEHDIIKYIEAENLLGWNEKTKKDGVILSLSGRHKIWYGYYRNSRLVGIGALMPLGKNRIRIKSIWIRPDCREQGLGAALTERLIADCKNKTIEARVYNPQFYLLRRFKLIEQKGKVSILERQADA